MSIAQKIKETLARITMKLRVFMLYFIIPRRKDNTFITIKDKNDGMGAQAQAIYSAMLYARIVKVKYVHTPIVSAEHNYKELPDWERQIERFFSFSTGEIKAKDINNQFEIVNLFSFSSMLSYLLRTPLHSLSKPVLFTSLHFHDFADKQVNEYKLIKTQLREKFDHNTTHYPLHYKNKHKKFLSIACHIRRGDVNNQNKHFIKKYGFSRFTDNQAYVEKLTLLSKILDQNKLPFEIHIYSQGNTNDFKELTNLAVLHLNESPFESFYNMVQADILITAKSSFSYSAALLSTGLIIYEPFWHQPLDTWFIYQQDLTLQDRLKRYIQKNILKSGGLDS